MAETDKKQEMNIPFEKFLKSRTIIISGEINQELVEKIAKQLFLLSSESEEPIKLFINSQGGHVESGDTIYDLIKYVNAPVYTIGTGWVASAAITIFLGAEKERRYSLPNTRYLIHQPMGGIRGSASDIKIEAEEIIKIRKRVNQIISKETGQSLKKVEKDTERNFWMSAEEAIKYGLVANVITKEKELKL